MKLLLISFFLSGAAFAQGVLDDPNQVRITELKQEGHLVSIRIVRGEPVRIFVVGKEEAKLDLSRLKLTVRRIKPYPGKILRTSLDNNYFIISDPIDLQKTTDLEVTTEIKNQSETLRFKLDNKLQ